VDSLNLNDYNVAEDFQDEPISSFPIAKGVIGVVVALIIIFGVASYSTNKRQANDQQRVQQLHEMADDSERTTRQMEIENQKLDDQIKHLKK
jgi:hypothetical protein